eukprot:gene19176-biopygen43322
MGVITYLGVLSFAMEDGGERLGTGDRLSTTLTLVLTAVAYKIVAADNVPK